MKTLTTFFLIFIACVASAQPKLDSTDLKNLIAIGEAYSGNPNATGKEFKKTMESLRTPVLNHIVDALIEVGKAGKSLFTSKYLSRPDHNELVLWYVIREIHYNMVTENQTPRPNIDVAKEILSKEIDERWLLDNYYYRIGSGIGMLFNTADLSKVNVEMDKLGLKNNTEKAIFFMNTIYQLAGARFKVLNMMKNDKKIIEFGEKLPMFNGQPYYYYTNFDYDDFEWIGYDKSQSYNKVNLENLFEMLLIHHNATANVKSVKEAKAIYYNSILYVPKYFKFSEMEDGLKDLYSKASAM